MEDEAGAELNTVLAGGMDLGANVVGFDADGDERFPWIVEKREGKSRAERMC